MSPQAGLCSCVLTNFDVQAASGAASTCALHDSRVDIFSHVPRRSLCLQQASATTRRREQAARWRDAAFRRTRVATTINGQGGPKGACAVVRCVSPFFGVCVPRSITSITPRGDMCASCVHVYVEGVHV